MSLLAEYLSSHLAASGLATLGNTTDVRRNATFGYPGKPLKSTWVILFYLRNFVYSYLD